MPVVSSDQRQIRQMVTNTRLILGVLAKVLLLNIITLRQWEERTERNSLSI